MTKVLEILNISKSYLTLSGKVNSLNNISFEVNKGDFIAIVGPSGCGKSTLLNILANIDKEYSGSFKLNGKIGYMLQSDALLPYLNNLDNAMLPKKLGYDVDKTYVINLFKKYNLSDFMYKYPSNLSGGMKQKLALIRTLSYKPDILLLDEPFSALDYQTRLLIEEDIYKLSKENNITIILVTHDISEAIALASKVIVLSKRPAHIKNIYDIKLKNNVSPIINRSDEKYNYYFNLIWKDIDKDG